MMKRLLVTGGTGFVGSAMLRHLAATARYEILASLRRPVDGAAFDNAWVKPLLVGDLDGDTCWQAGLAGVEVIIHLAGRAHVLKEQVADPLDEFRRVNVAGTLNLARQAAAAGVRRFVFISSIGVNGNHNTRPFTETDRPSPEEPYAISKLEAEQGLADLARKTGMEVVIIRPPLVYGPGAPGNFGRLVRWVGKGVPLPLGAIHNRRSLVSIDNLVDLIGCCVEHPAAANRTVLAGDGVDVSTTELLQCVGAAMGRPARLIPVPCWLLKWSAGLLGRGDMARRLCDSLQVDISGTRNLLGWTPPVGLQEGLTRAVKDVQHD